MNIRVIFSSIAVLLFTGLISQNSEAQNRFDALRYNTVYPGQDAATMAAPSLTDPQDIGVVLHNPAAAALFGRSVLSFDVGMRQVREEGEYLGELHEATDSQTRISQAAVNFRAPTERGSLVFGFGYNQLADFNRAQDVAGYSESSTITDLFLIDDYYFDTAFEAYALDVFEENGQEFYESSWRPPFNDFVGVDHFIDITERGQIGEYYAYGATEFQPNFFIGGSIGVVSGSYDYDRVFIEDPPSAVDDEYDITSIFTEDRIRTSILGYTGRLGLLYRPSNQLAFGVNLEIPSALSIEEDFDTYIETEAGFLDGGFENSEFNGSLEYQVKRPARLSAGATVSPAGGLSLSGSAEYVNYSSIEFEGLDESAEQREIQRNENRLIDREFEEVFNFQGSMSYRIDDVATPRAGIAYYPSPVAGRENDKYFYSAGLGLRLTRNTTLDLGLQVAHWNERIYDYLDVFGADLSALEDGLAMPDYTQQDIWRIHGMVGLTIGI